MVRESIGRRYSSPVDTCSVPVLQNAGAVVIDGSVSQVCFGATITHQFSDHRWLIVPVSGIQSHGKLSIFTAVSRLLVSYKQCMLVFSEVGRGARDPHVHPVFGNGRNFPDEGETTRRCDLEEAAQSNMHTYQYVVTLRFVCLSPLKNVPHPFARIERRS